MDSMIFSQLLAQAPTLLVQIVGMVLAVVFWRRAPGPCGLTLAALALMMLTTLSQTFLTFYFVQAQRDAGWAQQQVGWMISVTALVSSILRAAALGMLLAAVFVGRKAPAGAWQTPPR